MPDMTDWFGEELTAYSTQTGTAAGAVDLNSRDRLDWRDER